MALLYCSISYRDFRVLNETTWSLITKKFNIYEYESNDKYWRIRKNNSKENISNKEQNEFNEDPVDSGEDSDKTIT